MGAQDQSVTRRLARAAAQRPIRVIAAWGLAVVVSAVLVGGLLHGLSSSGHAVGSPDSERAARALDRAFPAAAQNQSTDVIVIRSTGRAVDDPAIRTAVGALVRDVRGLPGITSVLGPFDGVPGLVSSDRHAALVRLAAASDGDMQPVVAAVQRRDGRDGVSVGVTGEHTVGNDFATLSQRDLSHAELAFGLPAALVVLVLVFGAVVAGLVPVVLALISIVVGLGLVAVVSQVFSLSTFITNMLTGMGLALGIDYSLFVLSRVREERARGMELTAAIERAGATASRAVLFSGSTFVVSMFGMLLVRTSVMRSLAAGAIVVGIVSVAAALTLLPAMLSLLGDRVEALRVPSFGWRRGGGAASGEGAARPGDPGEAVAAERALWDGIIRRVLRRPGLSLAASASLMVLAAVPLLGLHVGANGVSTLPASLPSSHGFALLSRSFPAQNPDPAEIVVVGGASEARADLAALRTRLAREPSFGPGTVAASPSTGVLAMTTPVRGDPVAPAAIAAVRHLRADIIPAAFAGSTARVYVGGKTAENVDYFDAVTTPTPYVFAFVLGLSFVLLLVAFRSVAVALVSIVLNLLSVGAAYGLLTLVFVDGAATGLFGFQRVHTIEAWVPLFLFSVLFGLSMDYGVFLMSRIKERHDGGAPTAEAVRSGVVSTARIITGAALIIVVVFTGFATGELVMFQQMGFGIAVALLLDATIIRSVVLPSALVLLGERAWYLPRWLTWLPDLGVDGTRSSGVGSEAEADPEASASPPPVAVA